MRERVESLEETEAFCSTQLVSESSQSWMMLHENQYSTTTHTLRDNLRLGGLVSVVGLASLTRSDGSIIDKLKEVLSVASNNGKLLTVLAHGIKLVGKGSLELLTSDVGQLCLGNEGLGFSAHKLLLKDDNLGGVGLLVLQLSDLVGNLLLACTL